jgi:hypothetical protein
MFPSEGLDAKVPIGTRMKHALEVARRVRPSVYEQWGMRERARPPIPTGLTLPPPPA